VAINPETGLRTCHIDSKTKFKVYEFWSSDLLTNFKQAGIVRQSPPPYEKDCLMRSAPQSFPPQIVSPREQLTYIISKNHLKDTLIPFSVIADGDVQHCYWFIDNQYLKVVERDKTWLWQAKPGKHLLRVVDDHGMSSTIKLTVKIA
jgi:penicillin-binding protein 1C